jgi:hypothetical protein
MLVSKLFCGKIPQNVNGNVFSNLSFALLEGFVIQVVLSYCDIFHLLPLFSALIPKTPMRAKNRKLCF